MWNPPNDDFLETVWLIVKQIPKGVVSTYGQIATMIPPIDEVTPDDFKRFRARWVGSAMRQTPDGENIPWQRVINSQGKISLPGASGIKQRSLLEAEGIPFDDKGKVDLKVYGWEGPDDDWLDTYNLLPPDTFQAKGKPKQNPLF